MTKFLVLIATTLLGGRLSAGTLFYDLTLDGCTGGCGPVVPYGEIELDQGVDDQHVLVTASLFALGTPPQNSFFTDNGAHTALTFNITGHPDVSIGDFSDGTFSYTAGNSGNPPFGTFEYGISKSDSNDHCCSVLSFVVGVSSGTLHPEDFTSNSGGSFFAADIFSGQTGNTGAVASNGPCPDCGGGGTGQDLPEPWSFALAGTGLLGLGLFRKFASRA